MSDRAKTITTVVEKLLNDLSEHERGEVLAELAARLLPIKGQGSLDEVLGHHVSEISYAWLGRQEFPINQSNGHQ